VALGSLHDPRAEFRSASVPAKPRAVEPGEKDPSLPAIKAEAGSPAEKSATKGAKSA